MAYPFRKMSRPIAVIIGAGPAGLTAAYELLEKTDIQPIVYEMDDIVGGISRTVDYKGNRIDIGGHRFFSKSDRVMQWWQAIFPVQGFPPHGPDPEETDRVMLVRNRRSRIFFLQKFFDYPVSLSWRTLSNLGWRRSAKMMFSYIEARLFPIRPEKSLRDFLINRFGRELYLTFFRSYTKKVWGIPPHRITAEWGAQRIKGLSFSKAILHPVKQIIFQDSTLGQKKVEASLIQRFVYPKFGPGQLWEEVARRVEARGGQIRKNSRVIGIQAEGRQITAVQWRDEKIGQVQGQKLDYLFSTMPVRELVACLHDVPEEVARVAQGLRYRDFVVVGILAKKIVFGGQTVTPTEAAFPPDHWIYLQEKNVKAGRLQIFNNWSPYLVKDPRTVWLGLEYFCSEGDELWRRFDSEFMAFAAEELVQMGWVDRSDILDSTIVRVRKTYPIYFGAYEQFHLIRSFTDPLENLFLIGRNGMHRYNSQDHSMLTAMTAVENILNGVKTKENLWAVNTEKDYQEGA